MFLGSTEAKVVIEPPGSASESLDRPGNSVWFLPHFLSENQKSVETSFYFVS
mgnify:CR=1 FL=1